MGEFFRDLLSFAIGGIGGAIVTFVALRTRLALMDVRMNGHEHDIEKTNVRLEDTTRRLELRFKSLENRQMLELRVLAGIARKVGVDERFDDAVVRMLAGED